MNRTKMIDFLKNHFRYSTMNSWNGASSYAANVKLRNLHIPNDLQARAYDMLSMEEAYDGVNFVIDEFTQAHGYQYTIGFNGRSSGYLVLYESRREDTGYKSRCLQCGQMNYTKIEENSNICGRCNKPARKNLEKPLMRLVVASRGIDNDTDFEDWDTDSLRYRVKLVKEFDRAVEDCKRAFVAMVRDFEVEEETIMVPKKVKVLKEAV